jgi:hypothetical protein
MGKIGKNGQRLTGQRTIAMQKAKKKPDQISGPAGGLSGDGVFLPLRTLTYQIEQAFGASLATVPGKPIPGLKRFNAAIKILAAKVEAEDLANESN